MKFRTSTSADVPAFRRFWESAVSYQQARQLPLWPPFPVEQIESEIQAGLHFSSDFADGAMAGYFSVALSDEIIWAGRERGDAIYIHRMCVNPMRKGSNLTPAVLAWAKGYALSLGRTFVRMDTWADNEKLVEYYIKCGFRYVGDRQLSSAPGLPAHYSHTRLALFQNPAGESDGCGA